MPPAVIAALLKTLGVDPRELASSANMALELVKSVDARLTLIAAQNALIINMLAREGVVPMLAIPPYPNGTNTDIPDAN